MGKLKVVWLCHFSDAEIQSYLKPFKKVNEYAPWISRMLHILENDSRFELYVIAPHEYIRGIHKFDIRGIHYIFYNAHMPIIGRHWPVFFKWDYITDFFTNKLITKYLMSEINPDIIDLKGAENPYYSSSILQFIRKYPTILTIQGFISHSTQLQSNLVAKKVYYEKMIIKSMSNAFFRTKKMGNDLKTLNPSINLYWSLFPYAKITSPAIKKKLEYDIVFFASVTKDKGIGDLLEAVALIKKSNQNISLCVIGKGEIENYQQVADNLRISDNVYWAGFLPTQEDVFSLVLKAKISVLPTYHDIMPGGIVEAMMLGLPVVTYDVDSNSEINENDEVISLVKKGDIEELVRAIVELLDNSDLRVERGAKGKKRAKEMFVINNETFKTSLLDAYRSVINLSGHKLITS